MSQQNVAIVKRAMDAFNRRDLDDFDEIYTPDYEWLPALAGTVEHDSFRGREGIERYYGELRDTWDEFRVVCAEFRDLGDRVVVLASAEGCGRGSGVPVSAPMGIVFDFCEG